MMRERKGEERAKLPDERKKKKERERNKERNHTDDCAKSAAERERERLLGIIRREREKEREFASGCRLSLSLSVSLSLSRCSHAYSSLALQQPLSHSCTFFTLSSSLSQSFPSSVTSLLLHCNAAAAADVVNVISPSTLPALSLLFFSRLTAEQLDGGSSERKRARERERECVVVVFVVVVVVSLLPFHSNFLSHSLHR